MSAALVMEEPSVDRFEVAAASFTALVGRLKGDETAGMSLGDLETFLDKEGREGRTDSGPIARPKLPSIIRSENSPNLMPYPPTDSAEEPLSLCLRSCDR